MLSDTRIISWVLSSIIMLFMSASTQAALDELYRISVGTSISNFNSEIKINSRDGSINTGVDLESDLGFDSQLSYNWISGWYRVADNHRLSLTYNPIQRSTFWSNQNDVVIDNTTIKAGAAISSVVKSNIFDFSYIYSLYRKPEFELGLSAGVYWLRNNARVSAAGNVLAEGEITPVFKSDYFAEQKLQAPMPLFGLSATYEISPSWRANASARYFALQVSKVKGSIMSANISTEYYFNSNWGIGAGLSAFSLKVESANVVTSNFFEWSHNSAQLYAVYKY